MGLRPLEPSGDFLTERARFFGGDIITHICVMIVTGSDVTSALVWGVEEHLMFLTLSCASCEGSISSLSRWCWRVSGRTWRGGSVCEACAVSTRLPCEDPIFFVLDDPFCAKNAHVHCTRVTTLFGKRHKCSSAAGRLGRVCSLHTAQNHLRPAQLCAAFRACIRLLCPKLF